MYLSQADLEALYLTLQLALVSSLILLLISTPLAWWLSRQNTRLSSFIQTVVALPLILPPTVIGFYLLTAMSPNSPLGSLWHSISGNTLVFSFSGLVFGSIIYSLPFTVQPLYSAFKQMPQSLIEAAATLGATPIDRFFSVVLPYCKASFIAAATLSFAHTIGEFGIVLMIGGNIPGETQVLSLALYDYVETMQYEQAHRVALGLVVLSVLLLLPVYGFNRNHLLSIGKV